MTATREQITAAAKILQPQFVRTPDPSTRQVMDAAKAAGIELAGVWHLNRIHAEARRLDVVALLAEIEAAR